jgi:hypothetical protein
MNTATIKKTLEERCLTALVTVIEGCACPDDKPWYYCTCRDTKTFEYDCLCHNFVDVLNENAAPSDTPTIEAVAHLINKHSKARFVYMDCSHFWDPKYGYGDHFAMAKKAAER